MFEPSIESGESDRKVGLIKWILEHIVGIQNVNLIKQIRGRSSGHCDVTDQNKLHTCQGMFAEYLEIVVCDDLYTKTP